MSLQYVGLKDINGPLVALEGVTGVAYDEIARIRLNDGTERIGRVVELAGDKAVLQVFEGTNGISLTNTKTVFSACSTALASPLTDWARCSPKKWAT